MVVLPCAELAARTAAQKYTKSQCKWGLPVLAPGNRSGDGWGLGWDNLLEVEIIDVETADSMEVAYMHPCYTLLTPLTSCKLMGKSNRRRKSG